MLPALLRFSGVNYVGNTPCWNIDHLNHSGLNPAIHEEHMEQYLWTATVFGDHWSTEGRTGELAEAKSRAEAAQGGYLRPGGTCLED
jgi:hypothetical protein